MTAATLPASRLPRPPPERITSTGREQLGCWLTQRLELPPGPLFCIIAGQTRGPWPQTGVRSQLGASPSGSGCAEGSLLTQLRHAHAVDMAPEGVPLNVIQRQLGHTNLGVTSTYLLR